MAWSKDKGTIAKVNADYAKIQGDYAKTEASKVERFVEDNKTKWLPAVATVALRNSTYPNPQHGDTVRVTSEAKTYRYVSPNGWVVTDIYDATAIDQVTKQLVQTVKKNDVLTMANMGQDVKEAMTGGAVPVVGINAVNTPNIADKAVTVDKTAFINTGKNIFNKNALFPKTAISSTGVILVSENYSTSDYIPVNPNADYTVSGAVAVVIFFTKEKAILSRTTNRMGTFQTPENAYFIRVTVYVDSNVNNANVLQIESGALATPYESYKVSIANLEVPAKPINNELIIDGAVSKRKLNQDLVSEIDATRKVDTVLHRALVAVPNLQEYAYNAIEQLNSSGFGVEVTNLIMFAKHYKEWMHEFDILVFGREMNNLPYLSPVSAQEVVDALKAWKANGNKIIYHTSTTTHAIRLMGADATPIEEVSISSVLPVTIGGSNFTGKGVFRKGGYYPANMENILAGDFKPNGSVRSLSGEAGTIALIVAEEVGVTSATCAIYKPNEYAIIGYGGASGGIDDAPNYRYIDFGKLAKALITSEPSVELSFDKRYNRKIAAVGIDADLTNDVRTYEVFMEPFAKNKLEIGLVADNLTDELVDWYHRQEGNIEYNSHSSKHMVTSTITNEKHVIPNDQVVRLKKPNKIEENFIQSVTSEDGTVNYLNKGGWLIPKQSGEFTHDEHGRLLFSASDIGKTILISYYHTDEPREWLGSLDTLKRHRLLTNNSIYLTGNHRSMSKYTTATALREGVALCDHTNINMRSHFILYGNLIPKYVPFVSPFLKTGYGRAGFDGVVFSTSKAETKSTVFPSVIDRADRLKQPYVWYSHDYPFSETDSRSIHSGSDRYHADWKKATYDETLEYSKEMMQWVADYLNARNVYWEYRSDYTRYYNMLNQSIVYQSYKQNGKTYLNVENRGDARIDGITFRLNSAVKPLSVKALPNRQLPISQSSTEVYFYIGLSPGESTVIEIAY